MKICTKCDIEKEFSDFYNNKNTKDGLSTYCKKCQYKLQKEWNDNNEERIIRIKLKSLNKRLEEILKENN